MIWNWAKPSIQLSIHPEMVDRRRENSLFLDKYYYSLFHRSFVGDEYRPTTATGRGVVAGKCGEKEKKGTFASAQ